jgi:hypothetical protein
LKTEMSPEMPKASGNPAAMTSREPIAKNSGHQQQHRQGNDREARHMQPFDRHRQRIERSGERGYELEAQKRLAAWDYDASFREHLFDFYFERGVALRRQRFGRLT